LRRLRFTERYNSGNYPASPLPDGAAYLEQHQARNYFAHHYQRDAPHASDQINLGRLSIWPRVHCANDERGPDHQLFRSPGSRARLRFPPDWRQYRESEWDQLWRNRWDAAKLMS